MRPTSGRANSGTLRVFVCLFPKNCSKNIKFSMTATNPLPLSVAWVVFWRWGFCLGVSGLCILFLFLKLFVGLLVILTPYLFFSQDLQSPSREELHARKSTHPSKRLESTPLWAHPAAERQTPKQWKRDSMDFQPQQTEKETIATDQPRSAVGSPKKSRRL